MEVKNAKNLEKSSIKVPIPSLTNIFSQKNIVITALIIASFIIGSLYTKVQYLERNGGINVQATTAQVPSPQQQGAPQPTLGKQNVSIGHLPIKGQDNAKVTIVAFEDFRCPFCERFFTDVEQQLRKDYIDTGKAKFSFRHYQFLGPASVVAGNASECANEQNKFWEFHDYLYKNQPSESDTSMYTTDKMTEIAGTLGLNTDQFKTCLSTNKYQKNVDQDFADGQKVGVSGTPTFYINGTQLVGAQPYSAFKTIIDQELSK